MKNKSLKKVFVLTILFSLLTAFAPMPQEAKAASLTEVSDTISDSQGNQNATHIVKFTVATSTNQNGYFDVELSSDFGSTWVAGDIACPDSMTASKPQVRIARCTNPGPGAVAGGDKQITINNVTNPNVADPTSYLVYVRAVDENGIIWENADIRVAIIDDVDVHAKVDATLVFTINNVATGSPMADGYVPTHFGATTSLEFGTLVVGATSSLSQELRVITNADYGYTVTVEQDHELLSNTGSNINSFNNSQDTTGSTTAGVWADPDGILDVTNTYGHMALRSDDADLEAGGAGYNDFDGSKWAGLNNTDPMPVMLHDGPSDGQAQSIGKTRVAYAIKISALQESGDYYNTLTYICTPTY